jgi:hypothetical protein
MESTILSRFVSNYATSHSSTWALESWSVMMIRWRGLPQDDLSMESTILSIPLSIYATSLSSTWALDSWSVMMIRWRGLPKDDLSKESTILSRLLTILAFSPFSLGLRQDLLNNLDQVL